MNVFGGLELSAALVQFGITAFMGFFFALLVLKIKSILPLIVYHRLWNFTLMTGKEFSPNITSLSLVSMAISASLIVALLINMRNELRSKLSSV